MIQVGLLLNKLPPVKGDETLPFGVRIGAAAMTSRGAKETDIREACQLFDRCVQLAIRLRESHDKTVREHGVLTNEDERKPVSSRLTAAQLLADFKRFVLLDADAQKAISGLKRDMTLFARQFPVPSLSLD